jgi:hypothetical protein
MKMPIALLALLLSAAEAPSAEVTTPLRQRLEVNNRNFSAASSFLFFLIFFRCEGAQEAHP